MMLFSSLNIKQSQANIPNIILVKAITKEKKILKERATRDIKWSKCFVFDKLVSENGNFALQSKQIWHQSKDYNGSKLTGWLAFFAFSILLAYTGFHWSEQLRFEKLYRQIPLSV